MIAKTIRTCFPIAAKAVADKAEDINKLNVFPVPDGDTGTNMSLTLASVVKELTALPADADMEAIAGAITHGSLMGARGNSRLERGRGRRPAPFGEGRVPGRAQTGRGHHPHRASRHLHQG